MSLLSLSCLCHPTRSSLSPPPPPTFSQYEAVLELSERCYGDDKEKCLPALTNLANLYIAMENFDEAEVYLKKALLLSQKVLGKHAAATIHCVDQLVALFKAQNDMTSALSYLQWSFDGKKAELGGDNLDTLSAAYGASFIWVQLASRVSESSCLSRSLSRPP